LWAAAKQPARRLWLSCGRVPIAQPDEAAHVVGEIGEPDLQPLPGQTNRKRPVFAHRFGDCVGGPFRVPSCIGGGDP
jgi:hypothetical protein